MQLRPKNSEPMSIISHLQLDGFRLLELVIESDPNLDYDLPEGEYGLDKVEFDFLSREDDPTLTRFLLDVEARPTKGNCAYRRVKVKVDGIFKLDDEASDQVKDILPMAPLSILYGMARGIVANASSLGPRPYLLPSVNFFEVVKQKVDADVAERETKTARTAKKKRSSRKKTGK